MRGCNPLWRIRPSTLKTQLPWKKSSNAWNCPPMQASSLTRLSQCIQASTRLSASCASWSISRPQKSPTGTGSPPKHSSTHSPLWCLITACGLETLLSSNLVGLLWACHQPQQLPTSSWQSTRVHSPSCALPLLVHWHGLWHLAPRSRPPCWQEQLA